MRLIIAGSRDINPDRAAEEIYRLCSANEIDAVLCGMAAGVDMLGHWWASEMGVTIEEYPANWSELGKRAGYARNVEMAKNADTLLAIWDGESKGTRHMINIALDHGLDVTVRVIR